jgi:hypothetical protein
MFLRSFARTEYFWLCIIARGLDVCFFPHKLDSVSA